MAESLALEKQFKRNLAQAQKPAQTTGQLPNQTGGAFKGAQPGASPKDEAAFAGRDLALHQQQDRIKEMAENRNKKLKATAANPTPEGTGFLLKSAWLNLISSWGLTYIYLFIHFFAAYFMPFGSKLFCKFGEEWVPKSIKMKNKQAAKRMAKAIEIAEISGFVFVTAVIFLIIAIIVGSVGLIAYIWAHPVSFLRSIGQSWWQIIKCAGGVVVFGADYGTNCLAGAKTVAPASESATQPEETSKKPPDAAGSGTAGGSGTAPTAGHEETASGQ